MLAAADQQVFAVAVVGHGPADKALGIGARQQR
jgi:hypothetical protein